MEHDVEHEVADHAGEHAGDHASGGGFPPFDQIDTFASQIFWLAITFALLYFVLAYVLLPKLRKGLEDRDEAITGSIEKAAEISKEADDAVAAFEADIAKARAAARDTASKAKAEADAKISAQTAKVEAELNEKLAKAEAQIADVRAKAMAGVSDVAADTASAIVEKLTGASADPAAVKAAVANATGGR